MNYEIKFGTDGWRAVIADGFTFANLRRAAQAASDAARQLSKSRLLLVGYDRRFFSRQFAETAARVAVANGFRVEIADQPVSSPALSFQVKDRKAALGFMITASHNPPLFNGFKVKGPHGGSVDETVTALIESRVDVGDLRTGADAGKPADFISGYVANLKKLSKPALAQIKGRIVFDAMHGPGAEIFRRVTGDSDKVVCIRANADPLFGGVNPEPIESNLAALREAILREKASIGIAVDGDADRIGVMDEKGRYLPPHTVMPLILLHLIEGKKLKGKVIQTVSMGYLPERIAKHFGLPFEQVSVGFKYIAKRMGDEKVLLGGEESGGYGVGLWSPERDGLLCALLLLEMMAARKCTVSALVDDLYKRFGASHFRRVDFELKDAVNKDSWAARIAGQIGKDLAGRPVKGTSTMDGVRVTLEDDSWVLMRPSGTEPLIRTYAEGTSNAVVDALLKEADRFVHLPPPRRAADPKTKKTKVKI